MACLICGNERGDGVCPSCTRDGYEDHGCGCTTDPHGLLTVDPKCGKHKACYGLSPDCTGEGTYQVWDGRGLIDVCLICRRKWDNREPTDHQVFNATGTEGGVNYNRAWEQR